MVKLMMTHPAMRELEASVDALVHAHGLDACGWVDAGLDNARARYRAALRECARLIGPPVRVADGGPTECGPPI